MSKIIDKIRAILELSKNNPSAEEAATAAALAQELMFKHQIGMADLDVAEERDSGEIIADDIQRKMKNREPWKEAVLLGLTKSLGAEMFLHGRQAYRLLGTKETVQVVQYMFGYLALEIEAISDRAWKEASKDPKTVVMLTQGKWKKSFRMGAANTVRRRLEDQARYQKVQMKAMEQTPGLVRYQTTQEKLTAVMKSFNFRTVKDKSQYYADPYNKGVEAGKEVNLGGNKTLGGVAREIGQ